MTRRELLQRLSLAYAAACLGCRAKEPAMEWYDRELVCIHLFNPRETLPAPLLETAAHPPERRPRRNYFQMGLPELVVCTTETRFLDMFQYFWPFSRDDFKQLQGAVTIKFEKATLAGVADIEELARYLQEYKESLAQAGRTTAVVFTYNDFTRYWTPALIAACREAGVEELIVFKDPSRAPYLCDYPSRQKGFKKPPP